MTQDDINFLVMGMMRDKKAREWRDDNPDATAMMMPEGLAPGVEKASWDELLAFNGLLDYSEEYSPEIHDMLIAAGEEIDVTTDDAFFNAAIAAVATLGLGVAASGGKAALGATMASRGAATAPPTAVKTGMQLGPFASTTAGKAVNFRGLVRGSAAKLGPAASKWVSTTGVMPMQGTLPISRGLAAITQGVFRGKVQLTAPQIAARLQSLVARPTTVTEFLKKGALPVLVLGTANTAFSVAQNVIDPAAMAEADRIAAEIAGNPLPTVPAPYQHVPQMNSPLYAQGDVPQSPLGAPPGMQAAAGTFGTKVLGGGPRDGSFPALSAEIAGEAGAGAPPGFPTPPNGLEYGDNPLLGFPGKFGVAPYVEKGASPYEQYTGLPFQDTPRDYQARYWSSDVQNEVYGMSMADRQWLEARAIEAGLIDPDQPVLTAHLTEVMAVAMTEANTSAYVEDWRMSLERLAIENQEKEDTRAPYIRSPYIALDPAVAKQTVKSAIRSQLGREPNDSDMRVLAGGISADHRANFQAMQNADYERWLLEGRIADEGLTAADGPLDVGTFQGVDYGARFAERFDERFKNEIDRRERTTFVQSATQNLMTGLDRAGRMMRS
jgi:hypothetical protein